MKGDLDSRLRGGDRIILWGRRSRGIQPRNADGVGLLGYLYFRSAGVLPATGVPILFGAWGNVERVRKLPRGERCPPSTRERPEPNPNQAIHTRWHVRTIQGSRLPAIPLPSQFERASEFSLQLGLKRCRGNVEQPDVVHCIIGHLDLLK